MRPRGHVEKIGERWYLRQAPKVAGDPPPPRIRLHASQPIRSHAQARELADEWLDRQAPTTLKPGLAVTFNAFAEKFLATHVATLRPASRRRYAIHVATLQGELGADFLMDIDRDRLQGALIKLSKRYAVATLRQLRTRVLQILRLARDSGYAAHVIVTRDVRLPKNSAIEPERPSFTEAQLERILEASVEPFRTCYAVMAYAGLRAGEAAALRWSDVLIEAKVLRVRGNLTRDGIQAPKTAGSSASVQILPKLLDLLTAHRERSGSGSGLLFPTRTGKPMNVDSLRRRHFQPLLRTLGLPAPGLHALRHSCPKILLDMGLGVELVRRHMRHAHLSTTERYTHSSERDVRAAIDSAIARAP